MAIQTLIVDQASGVRSLFARVLRSLGCSTHEATDGGEAVEALQSTTIDLAVIEAEAALLSGVDLLRIIRESDTYANLPVVIVTAGTDQASLSEMVKLGAADCLTKPFDVELIKTRLQRIIKSISAAGTLHTMSGSDSGAQGSALIVDGDAEFRQFVATSVGATYVTTQMESGLEALRACQIRKFSVLVMGTNTGLLSPRLLARRLRRQATLENMRIVLAPLGSAEVGDQSAFDAVVPCTFVPEEFAQQFSQALARPRPGDAGPIDFVRATVVSATQQALGMMAGVDVALLEGSDRPAADALEASVVMTVENERAAIRMALVTEGTAAGQTASRMAGDTGVEVSTEDGLSALGKVLSVIAGRVQSQIGSEGRSMTVSTPSLRTRPPDVEADGMPLMLRFATVDGSLQFAVCLAITTAREGSAAPDAGSLAAIA